jgi:hypothetical protein
MQPAMRDPRGGTGIHILLDGEGAWPDLHTRRFERATTISVAGLPKSTKEGRASVAFRFDTQHQTIIAEMTLRELHSIWTAFVTKYGEDFMKPASSDLETRFACVIEELTQQLLAAKQRLGEAPVLDFSAADARYEQLKRAQAEEH